MLMRKAFFLLLIVLSTAFAQITADQAGQIAANYTDRGESIDLKPQAKTYDNGNSFYVIEIISMGKIITMIPVGTENGSIESSETVKPVLKIHYLANFFATDDTIPKFLEDTRTWAVRKHDLLESALGKLKYYEQQIPENISLLTLNPLKNAIQDSTPKNDAMREKIILMQSAINLIQRPGDIEITQSGFSTLFSYENAYLQTLDSVSAAASDFLNEIAGNDELKTQKPELAVAFTGIIDTYMLTEPTTSKKDSLTKNKNTLDGFFAGLDEKSNEYLIRLQDRISNSAAEQERKALWEKLYNYTNEYALILENKSTIPPANEADINQLEALLNQTQNYYTEGDYAKAKQNLGNISTLINKLKPLIGTYQPPITECGEGQIRECKADSGTGTQTCVNRRWTACVLPPPGINWYLIIGLGSVILLLLLFKKFRETREETVEEAPEYWTRRF